jgi:hypothetical protein
MALAICGLVVSSLPARAVTFTVDSTVDEPDALVGDGLCAGASGSCTLRAAVQETNALPGADAIIVPAGMYRLRVGPGYTVDEDAAAQGDLDITDDLSITGAGVGQTIVSAQKLDRVFQVLSPATVDMTGLTIRDGLSIAGCGIWNLGTLTLHQVQVTNNDSGAHDPGASCSGTGAGIENDGTLTMMDSMIDHNHGCASSYSWGGGLYNYGTATLINATVSYNKAHTGGGIFNYNTSTLALTNVTLMHNAARSPHVNSTAGMGGGLMNGGIATLVNVTITKNRANNRPYNGGGGVDNRLSSTALVTFKNSIITGNSRFDCSGSPAFYPNPAPGFMVSLDYNIRGSGCPVVLGGHDQDGAPMFGDVTRTFPRTLTLQPGSPAIDAGDPAVCPPTDERGLPRPQDGNGDNIATCDIGAYELQP